MKSSSKKLLTVCMTAGLAIGAVLTVNAASMADGQWCTGTGADANRYWFTLEPDGSRCIANTWEWVKDSDGVVRCYYFDANGWLVTDTTVDGNTVDADGHWVVDGVVQTAPADKDYYTHNANFINSASSKEQTEQPAGSQTQTPVNTAGGGLVKGSGKGDNPSSAEAAALGYTVSTVAGKTVSNSWANFTMTFPAASATINVGGADEGFDIQNIDDGALLTIKYMPINYYGGSTVDSFVQGFIKDGHEMMGATVAADVTFGDFTFKQVTIKMPNPSSTPFYDRGYIRAVEGTGYVQVITVEQNGSTETFQSVLNTMRKMA